MVDMAQSLRQASIRAVTGTTHTYEGDWHALFTSLSIADGDFNGRMLQYINTYLTTSYTEINGAMAALAANLSVDSFQAIGAFTANGGGWAGGGAAGTPIGLLLSLTYSA